MGLQVSGHYASQTNFPLTERTLKEQFNTCLQNSRSVEGKKKQARAKAAVSGTFNLYHLTNRRNKALRSQGEAFPDCH